MGNVATNPGEEVVSNSCTHIVSQRMSASAPPHPSISKQTV